MTPKILNFDVFNTCPAAVIVDTDNTLYAYEPAHVAAMHATCEKASRVLGISPDQFRAAYRKAREQIKNRLGSTASSHSRLLYFQRVLELLGLRTQVLLSLDFEQTYWRTFLTSAQLFSGVKEFLDDLRIADIPTAIVTDLTAQIQFRKLVYFGLDEYFHYVVTSEEAGSDKPSVAPFQVALEKFGKLNGPLWMIGDSPTCDIQGAREAIGAVTLQKKHAGVTVEEGVGSPDLVFENFEDLRPLLGRLMRSDQMSVA